MAVDKSLEQCLHQLQEKGFTEEALRIDKEPPGIEHVFRKACGEFLAEAKRKSEERAFWLEVPAVFKNDTPKFDFLFVVNPVKESVRLGKIYSYLGNVVDKIATLDGMINHTPQQLYERLLHLKSQNLQEYIQNNPQRATHQKKRP